MRLFGGEDDQYDRARVLRDLESVPTKVLVKKRSRILRFAKVWSKITPGRSEGTTP